MKLYLDNSFLNRPFDDPSISGNQIDSDILFVILYAVKANKVTLINSALIEYENSKNTQERRRNFVNHITKLSTHFQSVTPPIRSRAHKIQQMFSVDAIDALHVASAEAAKANYFITCDHALIKRCVDIIVTVCSPITFIQIYDDNNKKKSR